VEEAVGEQDASAAAWVLVEMGLVLLKASWEVVLTALILLKAAWTLRVSLDCQVLVEGAGILIIQF